MYKRQVLAFLREEMGLPNAKEEKEGSWSLEVLDVAPFQVGILEGSCSQPFSHIIKGIPAIWDEF